MGNGMNKVLPGLYVGNYRDSKDQQQLDKYQITHIIAIHDSPRRLLPDKHYLCVMAADTPDQNLSQYFSVCNDFIHAARLREGNVLIHCLAGMSRSVTVAVAYIMTATDLNWKEALKVVRAGRAVANPNVGFQTQLQEFEMYRLMEERRRLRERFPSTALEQLDRTKCSAALDSYRELLQNRDICEGNCTRGEKCPTGASRAEGDGASVNTAEDNLDAGGSASGADPPHKRYTSYMLTFAVEQWKTLRSPTRHSDDVADTHSADRLNVGDRDPGEKLMENVVYYAPWTKPDEQNAHDEKKSQEELVRNEDQVTDQATNENIIEMHAPLTKPDEQNAHDEKKSQEELVRDEDQVVATNENITEKHAE